MCSRSARGTSRRSRAAGLVISKPHLMPPLIERNDFASFVCELSFGYCGKLSRFRLFFELRDEGSRSGILHGRWQMAQAVNGVFKQSSHTEHHNI